MRPPRRIPTILGILIIIFSLSLTVFLFRGLRGYLGRASPEASPQEVKITNLSNAGFTVSWITAEAVGGTVSFGESPGLGSLALDERDQASGATGKYTTHQVTLRGLKPASKYYFKIISGGKTFDEAGQPFLLTTAPEIGVPEQTAQPIFGSVKNPDGTPASGAIVYLDLSLVTPLSTLVRSSGSWLITLNNARTADLTDFVRPKAETRLAIFVQGAKAGTSQAKITLSLSSPVPEITLGKDYDFISQAVVLASPTTTPSPGLGFKTPVSTSSPSLVSPASEAVPSDRPVFNGTGVPGKPVSIKVESATPVTASVTVDENGNWSWTPPAGLSPGEHTVTVTTTDEAGNPVEFIRKFIVLASGTQVAEAATPSATPSPTPSPKPTPSPSLRPSPTATPSTPPASGNLTPTILVLILSLTFLSLGFGKLFLLDKR